MGHHHWDSAGLRSRVSSNLSENKNFLTLDLKMSPLDAMTVLTALQHLPAKNAIFSAKMG